MKSALLTGMMFVFCTTNAPGQGKLLASDSLTRLGLIPATDSGNHMPNIAYTYNKPTKMPDRPVCKSKMQGNFYALFNIKVDAVVAWYSLHLTGFKKISGYESKRSQTAFYNPDGTIMIIVTGKRGPEGENMDAYAVAYERYQPGLSEKTIAGLTQGHIVCP
jgi:hypothetical protein